MGEFDIFVRQFLPKRTGATVEGLERLFGLTPLQARELMHSVPRVVKSRVPASELSRYERALAEIGAVYEIRPRAISPSPIIAVGGGPERVDAHESGTTLNLPAPRVDPGVGARERSPSAAPPAPSPDPNRTVRLEEDAASEEAAALSSADTLVERTSASTVLLHRPSRPPPRESVPPAGSAIRTQIEHRASPAPSVGTLPEARAPHGPVRPSDARELAPRASAPPPAQPSASGWHDFAPIDPPPPASAGLPSAADAWSLADAPPPATDTPTVVASNDVVAAWKILEPVRWAPKQSSPPSAGAPSPSASAWAPLEPEFEAPPAVPSFPAAGALPPPAAVPSLDGAVLPAPAPTALDDVGEAPLLGERPPRPRHPGAVAGPTLPRERPSADDRLPLERAVLAATGTRRGARAAGVRDGGARVEPDSTPFVWRLLLRAALGSTFFLAVMGLRHCQPLGSDVERALARWDEGAVGSAHGLPALDWMRPGAHQFVIVDKESVRSLVVALRHAGAVEVYVADVVQSGMTSIARALLVELPNGPGLRKNVLRVAREYAGDPTAFDDVGQTNVVLPL